MSPRIPLPPHPLEPLVFQHRGSLPRTRKAIQDKSLTLGFLGGSITDARAGHNWPEPVAAWFLDSFPEVRLHVENAGIGATGSDLAVFRADRDIIARDCDLIFIEYAVNDREAPRTRRARTREGLIRKLRQHTDADLLFVYTYSQPMYADMDRGALPESIADFEALGNHYGVGSIWMGARAFLEVKRGAMRWEEWLPDGLHPQFRGSAVYGQAVAEYLSRELDPVHGGTAIPPILPPMDPFNWEFARIIPPDEVALTGPWVVRRSSKLVWADQVLSTHTPGAKLAFPFKGRGAVIGVDFGKASAEFRYRIDGGAWKDSAFDRPDWVGPDGWWRSLVLAEDLVPGTHSCELEVVHGNAKGDGTVGARYTGTRLDINHLGCF